MSRTWALTVRGEANNWLAGEMRFSETHSGVSIETDYAGLAEVAIEVDDAEARQIRDWLSWYLAEGPEPGSEAG